jgi:hypothetical protein
MVVPTLRRCQMVRGELSFARAHVNHIGTISGSLITSQSLKLLVPLSERRHRLYPHEIPEVMWGLRLRLAEHEKQGEKEKAEIAFRTLFRLTNETPGRPKYPTFSWEIVKQYLEYYRDSFV